MKTITLYFRRFLVLLVTICSFSAFSQNQTFTTSGTFNVPAGVTQVTIKAWGAGGGGSDRSGNGSDGGNGGAGGGFRGGILSVTPGDNVSITIGSGGSGATNSNGSDGSNGGNTIIVHASAPTPGTITANGGAGGVVGTSGGGTAAVGGGGSFTGTVLSQISFNGGNGGIGDGDEGGAGAGGAGDSQNGGNGANASGTATPAGGAGGNNNGGNGGNGGNDRSGGNGSLYGGGGGASGDSTGTGGDGANGLVILSWTVSLPEINIQGNATSIVDGDTTPIIGDDTDFGNIDIAAGSNANIFTIQNTGVANLTLTGTGPTYVAISGTHASDFTVTANPTTPIAASGNTTFTITFNPSALGLRTAIVTITNNDSDENPYNFNIQGTGTTTAQEINIKGNSVTIADNDLIPSVSDDTDFGNVDLASGTNVHTFTIENLGTVTSLNLSGSPLVQIGGAHPGDFTVTALPSTPITASSSTTFNITFNPSVLGLRTANVTILNNDGDEGTYNFNIQGTGIDLCGTTISSYPYTEDFESGIGVWTQDTGDNFDWTRQTGGTPTSSTGPGSATSGSYYMFTEADSNNSNTSNFISPCFNLTGTTNPRFTFFYHMYGTNTGTINVNLSTDKGITYPISLFTHNAAVQNNTVSSWIPISVDLSSYIGQTIKIRVQGIVGTGNASDMAIDKITLTNKTNPTAAPGGVTSNLSLWLKGNDGHSYTDGQSVALWQDQGLASDVRANKTGQEPTYRDNATKNINFNPVVEFDNSYATYTKDTDFSHDNTSSEFLTGDHGLYTQEMFIVLVTDETPITNNFGFMDVYCADAHLNTNAEDATGIGFGYYTGRVSGEIICYAHDSYSSSESGDGYAVAEIGTGSSYDKVGIINTRNNAANTQQELFYNARNIETTQNDVAEYMNSSDTRFWLGRSEGWEASLNARVAEVISYKVRKTDADLTQERNRIQSYLGIKYGITLGVNGTSQDYVNSDGIVIWDQSVNTGYNYDIAGIGRDDASELNQKQSSSINNATDGSGPTQGIITMGLTDIYTTNNSNIATNPTAITDKQFLCWGNNGVDLNLAAATVNVNMSAGISPVLTTNVSFVAMQRIWKVVEHGGNIPTVKVSIPQNAIRNISPPGSYLMFISSTGVFDPTADYRVMTPDGSGNLEADYDFDGTKFITFGYAPQVIVERSIQFDGVQDYIEVGDYKDLNPTEFTVSAWIKRASATNNVSILSKRDAAFTEGYDFLIETGNRVEMIWNGGLENIRGNTIIPVDEWHHVAVIYSGGTANLYIDGVLDGTETGLSNPTSTTQSFIIAAAGKTSTTDFFEGNIDEVRIWDVALSTDQLHYIMNQEIEENATLVDGIELPTSITKNEVATVPWSNLAGYYPMSIYTYTNTNDHSNNLNQGALRNLDTVDFQTAPLPYESQANSSWTTDATWLNNTVQTLPNALSIVDGTTPIDWNIVETNHNISINTNTSLGRERSVLGLMVNSNKLTINGDTSSGTGNGLTVTHYLELNGSIDLEGESQLVQTDNSVLVVGGSGNLERDQQGTSDTYTYNYWSSPVGAVNTLTTNDTYKSRFTLPDVLMDGTIAATPGAINFITSGYNGTSSPFGLADYWVWKFANQTDGNYSAWQHMRSTGNILPGEGFTMKGPGTGSILTPQNYIFNGKPNNGDITLTISSNNDYLVGNPYPSAIDAHVFISDNPDTNGTLYFWEHWGGGSHYLGEYQGGYALYNYSGGVGVASYGTNDPDVGTGGTPTKLPGRYIPVSQGFFVYSAGGGSIKFENDQRIFEKDDATLDNSTFIRMDSSTNEPSFNYNEDDRMKFRIGFNSINQIHRQLLLTIDDNATANVDWGYEGKLNEEQIDDMYWMIDGGKYVIQGTNTVTNETIVPLGIHVRDNGINNITIDHLENVPDDVDIYVHDIALDIYHDLRQSDYDVNLIAGTYLDRFEIVFANPNSLGVNDNELNNIFEVFYNDDNIVIHNPNLLKVDSFELFNILGQSIFYSNEIESQNYTNIKVSNLSAGTYIINLSTEGSKISKKVLVK